MYYQSLMKLEALKSTLRQNAEMIADNTYAK